MNFLKNCLKGRKNCSCICNTMQKPNQSYQKHPLFIIKGLLVNKTKKQSEKKDWFQWQMQKQEIFKYENHKESNERIKINQKPLLKEETTQLRLMCSPLVCSRKKKRQELQHHHLHPLSVASSSPMCLPFWFSHVLCLLSLF